MLKVLVATRESQGERKSDFFTYQLKEGELVYWGSSECDYEKVDGKCGCRRCFIGIDTRGATTTAKVIESELSYAEWMKKVTEAQCKFLKQDSVYIDDDILKIAESYETGTILEKRGTVIKNRKAQLDKVTF